MTAGEQRPAAAVVTPNLTSVATTPLHRRAAVAVAIALTLAAGLTLPVAHNPGPFSPAFLPTWALLAVAADALTAYLFLGQFLGTRQPALAALAAAYLYSSLIIVAYLLTSPHVFAAGGLFGAGPQTAIWLWVCWHGGFPLGLLVYVWVEHRYGHVHLSGRAAGALAALLCCGIPALVLVMTLGTVAGQRLLPTLIQDGHYTALFSLGSVVGVLTWGLSAVAGLALLLRTRGQTMAQLWLSLAMLACGLDVALTIVAGSRYSIGWYMARVNSLVEASIVLCALLYEINALYARLAQQERAAQTMNQQLVAANATLDSLAREDALTGVPNRRMILETATTELARYHRSGSAFTLLMVDIDNFKLLNDTYGHLMGDQVLRVVAQTLRQAIRASDLIGRYGGEEFLILLTQAAGTSSVGAAEHIMQAVRHAGVEIGGQRAPVTVSIGASVVQPEDHTIDAVVQRADAALYEAKRAGKDRVMLTRAVASPTPSPSGHGGPALSGGA